MNTSDFFYDLPPELIAQTPAAERAASRLLIYNRSTQSVTDGVFSDITNHLHAGDVLVRNTTRVIPARLIGTREQTGGHMEFLLLRRTEGDRWECLAKPARRAVRTPKGASSKTHVASRGVPSRRAASR